MRCRTARCRPSSWCTESRRGIRTWPVDRAQRQRRAGGAAPRAVQAHVPPVHAPLYEQSAAVEQASAAVGSPRRTRARIIGRSPEEGCAQSPPSTGARSIVKFANRVTASYIATVAPPAADAERPLTAPGLAVDPVVAVRTPPRDTAAAARPTTAAAARSPARSGGAARGAAAARAALGGGGARGRPVSAAPRGAQPAPSPRRDPPRAVCHPGFAPRRRRSPPGECAAAWPRRRRRLRRRGARDHLTRVWRENLQPRREDAGDGGALGARSARIKCSCAL